jgi:hypothetical protein
LERLQKQAELGLRWIRCGWRLFLRNPWLLGGMGFCCSALAVALGQVPLVGGPFLALLAPTAVASFYIAIDGISKQKMKLPPALRLLAVKQSPREFMNIAREERRLMQVVVMGLYGLVVVVLTDILIWMIAGAAIMGPLTNLSASALFGVMIAILLRFAIYLMLAASLVFTLPLALLHDHALVPAVVDSLRSARHHGIALLAIVALSLAPFLLGGLASFYSTWIGYATGLLVGGMVLPISVCSLYCSYRTMFTVTQPVQRVSANLERANYG